MKRKIFTMMFLVLILGSLGGCQTLRGARPPLHALLVTDSTEVTAYHRGIGYTAKIGFTFTNTTGKTIARSGCGWPGSPDLEKKVDSRWVIAYNPVVLTCRTSPDFSWEPGTRLHDVLQFAAAERGHNFDPVINVDSIPGVYRLRWTFTVGTEAGAKGARSVEAISNEFVMKLISLPSSASNTH
jgi:hypothetical protein